MTLKKRAVGKNPTGAECVEAAKEAGFLFAGIVRLKAKKAKCYAGNLDPVDYGWYEYKDKWGPLDPSFASCDADGTLGKKQIITMYDTYDR